MGAALGAAIPPWPAADPDLDLSPLLVVVVTIVVAIVVARFLFAMELTGRVVMVLVFGGLFTPALADVTGLIPAMAIWFVALLLGSTIVRRSHAR
jgi:hypothetical protein